MARNTSVTLGQEYEEFITRKVAEGRFGSTSEAIRAGLRLLEEQEMRLERLRAAIDEGDASGPAVELDFDEFLRTRRRKA
ncbi:MAG: type II toxin-antitoxin system ParD family antitoxin [Rhizobiales bacterium]|nr:type II toxin-antitoxin system ParD family antitoxin [Hyphomicrobiales bacterium]OJU35049.1 MAG: antitoxin [Rhizobiales bacterium 68-8]